MENLRKDLVYSMRLGHTMVINCFKSAINFHKYITDPVLFPTDEIFDRSLWTSNEHYMKVVRDSEDHNLLQSKKMFICEPTFQLVVLHAFVDEEQIVRVCRNTPHWEKSFVKIIVSEFEQPKYPELIKQGGDLLGEDKQPKGKYGYLDVFLEGEVEQERWEHQQKMNEIKKSKTTCPYAGDPSQKYKF